MAVGAALFGPYERSYLDELYADVPDTRPRFLWPVTDDPFTMKPLRWFDDYGEAASFVSANLGRCNYFVGEPRRRRP
jgi:hypothetical protein